MDELINSILKDLTLPHIPREHALYAAFSLGKLAHAASKLSPAPRKPSASTSSARWRR